MGLVYGRVTGRGTQQCQDMELPYLEQEELPYLGAELPVQENM